MWGDDVCGGGVGIDSTVVGRGKWGGKSLKKGAPTEGGGGKSTDDG